MSAAVATPAVSPQETVAREEGGRTRAAIGAFAAAILTLGGGIGASLVYTDFPRVPVIDALRDASGIPIPGRAGLRTDQILFYDEHATILLVLSIGLAIGALALVLPLLYLFDAAKARRPEMPNVARIVAIAGPVLLAASELVLQIVVNVKAHNFATGGNLGTAAAHDALRSDAIVFAQILRQAAVIALGFAFVILALNAMRVGLLTRFMGILGIIVGVLFVVPIGSQLPIVQTFWLFALGVMFLGRWPSGLPPAWGAGVAVPWPTQQELRDAREARGDEDRPRALRRKRLPEPDPEPEPEPEMLDEPAGTPHPSSKKKKRRRRS